MGKTLIVYYFRKGENYWNGSIKNLSKGNTEIVAEMIADITGGDLFEVETVKPYAADYYACTDEAKKELREGARPELKAYADSLDGYDTIFVSFPTGGERCPWQCLRFWNIITWKENASFPSAPTRGAAWAAASAI